MFAAHPSLTLPPNTRQQLWRYYSAERLRDLLTSSELFFTELSRFDDALEGRLTRRTREHLSRWTRHQQGKDVLASERSVDQYEKFHDDFLVSCWHMNDFESFLMWKAYADRGLAVRTTFERVRAALAEAKEHVTGGMVNYVDHERDRTSVGNVVQTIMVKAVQYSDERELRLLLWDKEPANATLNRVEGGVRVKLPVGVLIDAIVVHPNAADLSGEVLRLAEGSGISVVASALSFKGRG